MTLFGKWATWRDDILMSKNQLRRFCSTVKVLKGRISWGGESEFSVDFRMTQQINNLLAMQETQETWVWSLGQKDPLEEENGNPLSGVRFLVRLGTLANQAPPSMGIFWSVLPFSSAGNLPHPGTHVSYVSFIAGGFFTTGATWETKAIRVLIIFHCVQTSSWLFGGEVTEWCSRNPVLSSKWPSSTLVRTSVSAGELKDVCIFLEEELGSCPKTTLLFLKCFSSEAFPPFLDKQLLEYALWSSGKVKEVEWNLFPTNKKWEKVRECGSWGPHRVLLGFMTVTLASLHLCLNLVPLFCPWEHSAVACCSLICIAVMLCSHAWVLWNWCWLVL